MANRQLFRTILLQTLYEWDMRGNNNSELPQYLEYTLRNFNDSPEDNISQALETLISIGKKHKVIDEIITKAAPDWSISKISITDRNILRYGLYELLFEDHEVVPPKVAINEAVELAKKFGGPKSNKFVNGILGAVYREIGEPGKDQETKKKMSDVAYEDMPIDQKGAAVVYSIDENNVIRIGMVHDVFGYWTLSKGTVEDNEGVEEGTVRILKKKTDWSILIKEEIGSNEYIAYPPERGPVRKNVTYFLAQSEHTQPQLEEDPGGINDVRWFELGEISDLNIYEDVSQMLIKSIGMISVLSGIDFPKDNIERQLEKPQKENEETEENLESEDVVVAEDVNMSSMKVTELKALAKERGVEGYTALKKAELISLLSQK